MIHVIYGSTGEYSDHDEWPVRAFLSEKMARQEVVRLTERGHQYNKQFGGKWSVEARADRAEWDPAFQSNCGFNYTPEETKESK